MLLGDLSSQDSKQDYLNSTQKILQSIAPNIARIDNSVIPAGGEVQFIENLESTARANGLTIEINSLSNEDNLKSASTTLTSTLKIVTTTTGSWKGVYAFLAELESSPFKIKISKFQLSNSTSDIGAGTKISNSIWQSSFEIGVLKYK